MSDEFPSPIECGIVILMNTIDVQGMEIAYRRQGTGPPVVLLHGFPLQHALWRYVVDSLGDDLDVIALDLPGFGRSQTPHAGPWSMEMFADLVAGLIEKLAIQQPVHLVGLSMGGYISFEFQRKFSRRLASLALFHTRPSADDEAVRRARQQMAARVLREGQDVAVEAMLPKLFAQGSYQDRQDVVAEVREMIKGTSCESIAAGQRAMADRRDATSWLPMIDCPVLVVAGDDDRITPASEMRSWSRQIPNATFVEIASAGHTSPLENPTDVTFAMRRFLEPFLHA